MQKIQVLVFPCGSEVGLELHNALKDISFIRLIGASSMEDHGRFVYQNYVGDVPFIDAPDFLEKFNAVLERERVDYIYPAMDQVIYVLSQLREKLRAALIAPGHDAVCVCRNKARTYERLKGLSFVPRTYQSPEEVEKFPVIIKPEEGYGAKGFQILDAREKLARTLAESAVPNVICEYLSGEEYTVDCFTDRHGTLRYASCRSRGRIRNGISVSSALQARDERIGEIAEQISERIPMRGAWFFQLKRDSFGEYKLLEAATRVAGTMCLERAVGVNLPLLSVFDAMGYDVEIACQFDCAQVDRALYNTFRLPKRFSEVYVDFDDTITVHGKVNCQLMRYLYQCVNEDIPLRLVTKHEGNILEDLGKCRISPGLFAEIITLGRTEKKADYICPKPDALFLDDSYSERRGIAQAFGITVLGTDSVEALIDYRQ